MEMMDDSGFLSEEKERLIIQNTQELLRLIRLTPLFWATLSKYDVLSSEEIGEIQRMGTTSPQNQIYKLLDHVIIGTKRRYSGLLRALAETGQEHIVTQVLKEEMPEPLSAQKSSTESVIEDGHAAQKINTLESDDSGTLSSSLVASSRQEDYQKIIDDVNKSHGSKTDDRAHPLQSKNVNNASETPLSEQKVDLLRQKEPELLEFVRLSPSFWAHLRKHNVVLDNDVDHFQKGGTASDQAQISSLVKHLLTVTNLKYQGFINALVETGQQHIATLILGEDMPSKLSTGQKNLPSDKGLVLLEKLPILKEEIQITDKFWEILLHHHVLSHFEIDLFKGQENSSGQVQSLVEYLLNGTNNTYRGFLYALSETGQRHVVTDVLQDHVVDLSPAAQEDQDHGFSLLLTQSKKKLLKDKAPELIARITPSSFLWVLMTKYGAITKLDAKNIETGKGSAEGNVCKILEILQKGTMGHYAAFVQSLIESKQEAVVTDILGEDVSRYKINKTGPVITNPKLNEAVTNLRGEYCRRIFSSSLYEDIDVKDVYTSLNLVEKLKNGTSKKITENDVLLRTGDAQVLTLCVGDAGTGKSTLAQRLAWLWAKGQKDALPFWSTIKAVIFLQPTDEAETLQQTLRNAIPGKKVYKDLILELFNDEPENILLFVEAFDQFQDTSVIKDVKQLIKDQGTNVFMTMRKNHPCLTQTFQSWFTQHIEVLGFSPADSIQYAKTFLSQIDCNIEEDRFLESIKEKPIFKTNPLNLTLACQLFSSGELEDYYLETLTEVELYSMRESRMVERELELKHQCSPDELPERKNEELLKIRTLAVYMFLTHKTLCRKADLNYLNINSTSPAMVLLEKHQTLTVKHGKDHFWVWPHARLQEFDAAMALVGTGYFTGSLWPLWVANQPNLNSVSQLIAAVLRIDGRYDDVATLTTATMLLQCKTECTTEGKQRDESSHPCRWITKVKETLSNTMHTDKLFDGHRCKLIQPLLNPPDLERICTCKGSLFNGNINIFEHVQACWKLGDLHVERDKFISRTESLLLPAIDRSESETLHIMLSKTSQWTDIWKVSGILRPTVLEIHAGLSSTSIQAALTKSDEWTECVDEILEIVRPQVLHVHHVQNIHRPTEQLISLVNEKQYLIDIRDSTWTIWQSGGNVKTTQEYIPGTCRFVFISRTRDDEITFNVQTLQDTLCVKPTDEYLKRHTTTFNIGFPTAHSQCESQSDQTPTEWQEVICKLLDVWHPENKMLIRSVKNDMFDEVVDEKMKLWLRKTKDYDVIPEEVDGISFHHMTQASQDLAGKQSYFYNTCDGRTNIRVQDLADIADIKASDISISVKDTLNLFISDARDCASTSDLAAEFDSSILHLLAEFGVQRVVIQKDHANIDSRALLNAINENCMAWADNVDFKVKTDNRQLQINRVCTETIEVAGTSQPVQIQHHGTGEVTLTVGRLSDCMVLQKGHINISLKILRVDTKPMPSCPRWEDIDKNEERSSCSSAVSIKHVFHHLVETFPASFLYIHMLRTESEIKNDRFFMSLEDGNLYWFTWNQDGTMLLITRKDNVHTVEVPDTARCIRTYPEGDEDMVIVADQLSDCMVLQKEHIKIPGQWELLVHVNCVLNQDKGTSTCGPTDGWQQTITHLLETFKPPIVNISVLRTGTDIQDDRFYMSLENGSLYWCKWNSGGTLLVITRKDNVQTVKVPDTARCVRTYPHGDEDTAIVADHLSDCVVLKKEHIRQPGQCKLAVYVNRVLNQDKETSTGGSKTEGWQQTITNLLETFHPPIVDINVLKNGSDIQHDRFFLSLEDGSLYRCKCISGGTIFVITRKDNVQTLEVPDTARCIRTYPQGDEDIMILVDQLSDCMVLQKVHIKKPGECNLAVYVNSVLNQPKSMSTCGPTDGWHQTITQLLETFQPPIVQINVLRTGSDMQDDRFFMSLEDGSLYWCNWNSGGTVLIITRKDKIQKVEIPETTSGIIRTYPEGEDDMVIVADQLSNCMVLQKEHIKQPGLCNLDVYVNRVLNQDKGMSTCGPTDGWQQSITHLLETFHPPVVSINVLRTGSDMQEDRFFPSLEKSTLYWCKWNNGGTMFVMIRKENVKTVEVPDTARCIRNFSVADEGIMILADHLSDCMVLKKEHITQPGQCNLSVFVNRVLKLDSGMSSCGSTEGWQQTITHLLETFQPPIVLIHDLRTGSDMQDDIFFMSLEDGSLYWCVWTEQGTTLVVIRLEKVASVDVPNTSRHVCIYQDDQAEIVAIVAGRLSDCTALQKEHLETTAHYNLAVHLTPTHTHGADEAARYQAAAGWQHILLYLLDTFHPPSIVVHAVITDAEMKNGIYMVLGDGSFYRCFMNQTNNRLTVQRKESFQMLKVPGTSRCVGIMQEEDGAVLVVANQLTDCLTLQSDHIQTIDGLTLRVDLSLILSHPEAARPDTASDCHQTIHHLLDTFHPPLLIIQGTRNCYQRLKTFSRKMKDGSLYEGAWDNDNSTFVIVKLVPVLPKITKLKSFFRSLTSK